MLASALAEDTEAVVLSVDLANDFTSIHRAVMFAAVQQPAPALLLMVQWLFGDETPLHNIRALEGAPSDVSQHGVQQGDPLGVSLFFLTLQLVMNTSRIEGSLVGPVSSLSVRTGKESPYSPHTVPWRKDILTVMVPKA